MSASATGADLENCLKVSRQDLDEASAQRQLQYFMQLTNLPVEARNAELRRNPNFFPESAVAAKLAERRDGDYVRAFPVTQ